MASDRVSSRLVTGALVGAAAGLVGGLLGAREARRSDRRWHEAILRRYREADFRPPPDRVSAFLVEEMPGDRVTREMVDADGGYWLHPPMVTFAVDRARRIRGVHVLGPDTTGPTFHPLAGRAP